MKTHIFIFPHQLFAQHPAREKYPEAHVHIIEDSLFFGDSHYPINFHAHKLVLHRASMKSYAKGIEKHTYHKYEKLPLSKKSFPELNPGDHVVTTDLHDFILEKRFAQLCKQNNWSPEIISTPMFFNTSEENKEILGGKKPFMASFYKYQRQKIDILINGDGTPVGGKWSFDAENRKKLPKERLGLSPKIPKIQKTALIKEAVEYVQKNFPNAIGNPESFWYPTTHEESVSWLQDFLEHRFQDFGAYEDAFEPNEHTLYHSVLTPMLNVGLLTPKQVIQATRQYAEKNEIPLASYEGFLRQIIGWREFIRATYESRAVQMRTNNHWNHTRPIPEAFYTGTTGILPIDTTIKRLVETSYCHHIERLMVLGGFMFLCEINPKEIYKWFMEMFIDSYDWVMVPNVYAMSQNSAGGLITTKPYFSGSNYIRKMSHYPKGEWCEIWDALYWRWILKHKESLQKNPRWAMMCRMADKKSEAQKTLYISTAEIFFSKLWK